MLATVSKISIQRHKSFFKIQDTIEYLGEASKEMYIFVRDKLKIPFYYRLVERLSG